MRTMRSRSYSSTNPLNMRYRSRMTRHRSHLSMFPGPNNWRKLMRTPTAIAHRKCQADTLHILLLTIESRNSSTSTSLNWNGSQPTSRRCQMCYSDIVQRCTMIPDTLRTDCRRSCLHRLYRQIRLMESSTPDSQWKPSIEVCLLDKSHTHCDRCYPHRS